MCNNLETNISMVAFNYDFYVLTEFTSALKMKINLWSQHLFLPNMEHVQKLLCLARTHSFFFSFFLFLFLFRFRFNPTVLYKWFQAQSIHWFANHKPIYFVSDLFYARWFNFVVTRTDWIRTAFWNMLYK